MAKREKNSTWSTLRRRPPSREPKSRLLVVCEGKKTEVRYFEDLRRAVRSSLVDVEIHDEHGVPKTLVECAVRKMKEADKDAKRQRDENLKYNSVWCVFDVDEHPSLPEAKQQAQAHNVRLAVSNPCFELWALLHFQDQSAELDRHQARQRLKKHLPSYDKELPFNDIDLHWKDARKRALALEKRHETADQPGGNPSTAVHELVTLIRGPQREPGPPASPTATHSTA